MNILEKLHQAFFTFLQTTFSLSPEQLKAVTINLNADAQKQAFGDLTCNAALMLAQPLKRNPKDIAARIVAEFKHEYIDRIEIAGPGFLNFFLKPPVFVALAHDLYQMKDAFFKLPAATPKKNFSIEFVSANPTGPLHLGHGRGGIIGDVLGNIIRFLGHQATKEFYINDAGSQMQKLGLSLKARCHQALGQNIPVPEEGYQGEYLIALAQQCIQEFGPDVVEKSDEFFTLYAKNHLLEQIKHTLADYGIHFDVWFSEKTLHESGAIKKALETLTKNGYTYEKDGALWFAATTFKDDKDRVLKKANGELTYIAADVAYLRNKLDRHFDHLIMVLGQDHHSYVVRLKGILQALGYSPDMLDVILYQLVTLKESGQQVRMSKRAGKIVTLKDIIETVGADVARFFYLNRKADAHLEFDIDLALKKTEENPVYYIQYAYVRTNSILDKAGQESQLANITHTDITELGQAEIILLKKIIVLKEILEAISTNYQTHILTYYVLELAQQFHSYYSKNRVIDLEHIQQSRTRLGLIKILNNTFNLCLTLLGISRPETM